MEFTKDLLCCFKNLVNDGDEIFSDFLVEAGDKIFPCHRFVLGACSSFFRVLFHSDMKETNRKFLYYHENELNEENFLDVWKAAHFLEIDFILSACRKIAMETVNERNCHEYLWHAKLLDDKTVDIILEYIKCNFDKFKDSECLMELDGEDLLSIVRDANLKTDREDNVVDTILKWVSHSVTEECLPESNFSETINMEINSSRELECLSSDNEVVRDDFLVPLLSASRLASLNEDYLIDLFQHHQIVDNRMARDLIFKASRYSSGIRNSYWPAYACHRESSQWEDVVLMPGLLKSILVFNLTTRTMTNIAHCSELAHDGVFNIHKGVVYLSGYTADDKDSLAMFQLERGKWRKVANVQGSYCEHPHEWGFQARHQTLMSFSVGGQIFVVHLSTRTIFVWKPVTCTDLQKTTTVPRGMQIVYATPYKSLILVICANINKTATFNIYDTTRQEWRQTVSLDGLCTQDITSFHKEDKVYFLTSDAKLYVCVESDGGGVTLKHVTTFPNYNCTLIGALVYIEDLFVFVRESIFTSVQKSDLTSFEFLDLFRRVHVIVVKDMCQSLVTTCVLKGQM
ncbi:hypothetical protein Btru_013071 [Bulinus truncatus]|nr:hypothetical protein Btru_013071 [Bulinus truncatus]